MLKLGQNYDLLCNMIIRPPRYVYDIGDLGPKFFAAGGKPAQRTDFELRNARGMIIQCSHFEPLQNWEKRRPCVIYLHGNGGCRIEALDVVHTLLPADVSVLALDFAGSGLSDGEYVSLGAWEQFDVATVVQYLREANRCTTIGLWGRSMGAVTAILYSLQDPSIACMVLDSPFYSLQKISEDLVLNIETLQKMPRFTKFAVGLGLKAIRSSIKKRAKFDIRSLEILEMAPRCFIPALFIHGRDDNFILPIHSELLHAKYGGDKNRILVDGNHNSIRPNFFMDSAVIFFNNTLYNGQAHNNTTGPEAAVLPHLPQSTVQLQATIQTQQLSNIMNSFHLQNELHHTQPNNNINNGQATQSLTQVLTQPQTETQAEVQKQTLAQAQAQAHAQTQHDQTHANAGGLDANSIHSTTNHVYANGVSSQTNGSVVIDDMVIGNKVVIDGHEIELDEEDLDDDDLDNYYAPLVLPSFPTSTNTQSTNPTFSSPAHPAVSSSVNSTANSPAITPIKPHDAFSKPEMPHELSFDVDLQLQMRANSLDPNNVSQLDLSSYFGSPHTVGALPMHDSTQLLVQNLTRLAQNPNQIPAQEYTPAQPEPTQTQTQTHTHTQTQAETQPEAGHTQEPAAAQPAHDLHQEDAAQQPASAHENIPEEIEEEDDEDEEEIDLNSNNISGGPVSFGVSSEVPEELDN